MWAWRTDISYRKTEPPSRARLGDSHLEGAFKMMPTRPVPLLLLDFLLCSVSCCYVLLATLYLVLCAYHSGACLLPTLGLRMIDVALY